MIQKIDAPISVITTWSTGVHDKVKPYLFYWNNDCYKVKKLGMYFTRKVGNNVIHVFTVSDDTHCYRLELDSQRLRWRLKEVSDGMAG